eukprot:1596736-Ditylum_brightwellii.AAC.1
MVLKGEFNTEELDELQKLFIQHCKMGTSDNLINTKITKNQWKDKVAKWRESTTTFLSGRLLGHFKALICQFEESPDTKEGREMYRKEMI